CESIADEIESVCPRTFPYKNWGRENSCVKTTMGQLLDSYKDCLSGDQLSEVRNCVLAELGLSSEGRPDKDPLPHEL
ncbi:MAG: hypothetical protein JSW58_12160, partial [Candidatus Latescibacterota bacterium]